jgi:hypothetical protein
MSAESESGSTGWGILLGIVLGILLVALLGSAFLFFKMPSVVIPRGKALEQNLAITRAEALNMAMAAFVQSRGRDNASKAWQRAGSLQARYQLLFPFLAFAPVSCEQYMPLDFRFELPKEIGSSKVRLFGKNGAVEY